VHWLGLVEEAGRPEISGTRLALCLCKIRTAASPEKSWVVIAHCLGTIPAMLTGIYVLETGELCNREF